MTQNIFATGMGVAQGLQGLKAEQQRQNAIDTSSQYVAEDRAAMAGQGEQQAQTAQSLSALKQQYADSGDPAIMRQIIMADPEFSANIQKQFGVIDDNTRNQALNAAATLKQMVETDPAQAAQFWQQNLASNPAFAELADNFQSGDMEGALNEIGYGVTAIGGQESYEGIFGGGDKDQGKIGTYNPRDYTVDSFSAFVQGGKKDPSLLVKADDIVMYNGVPYVSQPDGRYAPMNISGDGKPVASTDDLIDTKVKETKALAQADLEIAQDDPEAIAQKAKESAFRADTIDVIDQLLGSDIDKISGTVGKLPSFMPKTEDMLVQADRLSSLLTAENMDIMTGVLSETDIKIIANLSGGFGLEKDEKGNPVRIKGSEEAFRNRMEVVKKGLHAVEIVPQLTEEMPTAENGTVVTDTETGYKFIFNNGRWVAK